VVSLDQLGCGGGVCSRHRHAWLLVGLSQVQREYDSSMQRFNDVSARSSKLLMLPMEL